MIKYILTQIIHCWRHFSFNFKIDQFPKFPTVVALTRPSPGLGEIRLALQIDCHRKIGERLLGINNQVGLVQLETVSVS